MSLNLVFVTIDGVDECLEVDMHSATVEEIACAFGCQSLRRAGSSAVLSPKVMLKTLVNGDNSADRRLALEAARAGVSHQKLSHLSQSSAFDAQA